MTRFLAIAVACFPLASASALSGESNFAVAGVRSPGVRSPGVSSSLAPHTLPHGFAQPTLQVTMSAPLEGVLRDVLVEEGETVEKDQLLAVMDNRIALAAVEVALAAAERTGDIDNAKSALELASTFVSRMESLREAEAGAEFEWEQAQARRDQAAAALATALEDQLQAQCNLLLAKARMERHNIRAPFGGTILHIQSSLGKTLTPSDELLTLVQWESLDAQLHLPIKLLGTLKAGQTYNLLASTPVDRTIHGRLIFAAPIINSPTQTFRCLFRIDNKDLRLPAGFAVRFDQAHPEPLREETP